MCLLGLKGALHLQDVELNKLCVRAGERVSAFLGLCFRVLVCLCACVLLSVRGLRAEWALPTRRRAHTLLVERQRAITTAGSNKNRSAADAFIFSHHLRVRE